MQKTAVHLTEMARRVLCIGLFAQIVLGLLWMFCNFFSFQEFEESYFLLKVSRSFLCDEYTGILYPLLIGAARGIASVIPAPYYCFLYLAQLAAAFGAAVFFWKCLDEHSVFKCLALVTVPIVMQCHLAVLPVSFTCSLLLCQVGIVLKKRGAAEPSETAGAFSEVRDLAGLGVLWLAETLLMPDYLWLGAMPVLFFAIRQIVWLSQSAKRQMMSVILVTAAFLGMVPGVFGLTVQKGAYGRMEKSLQAALMRRNVGSCFGVVYAQWPEELKNALSDEDITFCLEHSGGMKEILGDRVEKTLGRQKAGEIYRRMAALGWKRNFREVRREMAMDFAGYAFAPLMQNLYLEADSYKSFGSGNYEVMRTCAPRITYAAVWYGGFWFAAGIVLTLLLTGVRCLQGISGMAGTSGKIFCVLFLSAICIWYTLDGYGVMDQKSSLIVTVLWTAWMCIAAAERYGTETHRKGNGK